MADATTTPKGYLEVGKVIDGDREGQVFIGVPDGCYDRVEKPLSGAVLHVGIVGGEEKVRWLINALMGQISLDVAEYDESEDDLR